MKNLLHHKVLIHIRIAILIACVVLLSISKAKASHIYGADLFYTHVSGNTYTVTMNIYGDCGGGAFPSLSTSSPQITVFNGTTSFTTISLLIQNPTAGVEVTPVCLSQINNTKCTNTNSTLPGVKKFVYSRNVTLNTTSTNWRFRFTGNMGSSTQAGRTASITNIPSAGSSIMNLEATLNNINGPNSSPTYTTIPTPFFCISKAASYNPGAIDPNTDSLTYSLVPGLTTGGVVTYNTGYTATTPLAATTGTFSTSTSTGQVNFTPNLVQQSLVVHSVSEYKNGVLVGTSMREMTFVVLNNCNNNPPGGLITNNNAGKIATGSTAISVCQSAGIVNFNINATDLDTDVVNVTYTGLPSGATFVVGNNNTIAPIGLFTWNVSSVAPGSYNFFITYTDDGCPLSSKQTVAYTVTVLPRPAVTLAITAPATCTKKAVFTMTPSIAPTPWRLQVLQGTAQLHNFNNVTGVQTDSLAPGTYTIRVTNADTCFKDTTLVIAPPPTIGISLAVTPPKCFGDTNAIVTITASAGKAPYTYAINTGAFGSSATFSNLAAGYHTLKIKDANDCVKDSLILISNPLRVGANVVLNQPPCNYFNSGVITITGKNTVSPYTYAFGTGTYSSTNVFSGLYSGSYPVKVKDNNNCVLDTTIVLPDSIKVSANAIITNILCNADSTGVITLNAFGATAPYRYQRIGAGALSPINTFTGLKAITHNFHIEDTNRCYLDTAITLTQPTRVSGTVSVAFVLCHGDTSGSITLNGTGGVNPYTYAIGSGIYDTARVFSPLAAGTYAMHIKDNNGCIRDTNITVSQPTELKFATLQITNPLCFGLSTGQVVITGTGGVPGYNYAVGTGTFISGNTFGGLAAGQYTFRIRDNNGCIKDTIITITQPARIVPTANLKRSTCKPLNNGVITLGASGGVPAYTYALNSGTYSANPVFTPLAAGMYVMHVRDVNNCILDTVVILGDSMTVTAGVTITDALCYDSSSGIISTIGGGAVAPYTYAIGTGTFGPSGAFGGLPANSYTVRVRDNIGCRKDTVVTVSEPTRVVPTLVLTNPTCNGYTNGTVVVSATGGTPGYVQTFNNNPFIANPTLIGMTAGTHIISVMDANGCRIDTSIKLTEPPGMKFDLQVTNLLCFGDTTGTVSIDGTGGTPPFSYAYDQTPFVTTPILAKISAGTHQIKMRDANGCIKDTNVTLTEPARLLITNPFITNPTCEGFADGSVKAYGNGGVQPYQYAANGGNYGDANLLGQLKEGENIIRIKDANNCRFDTTLVLTGYPHIIYNYAISEPVSCFEGADGRITLAVSGGVQPLMYKIDGGSSGSNFVFDSLKAGRHTFRVTDSAGCFKDSAFVVETPEKLVITTKVTPNDCAGMDNGGKIEAYVAGGTGSFNYRWSTKPEQYGYSIEDMPNGTYEVVVTDANDCTDSVTATIVYDNCCIIFVPDAFSPNSDGLNDVIRARAKGDFELETFSIYNRFGQRVFETKDMNKGWDGIFAGARQDLGTYNYFIKGICGNAGKEEVMQKGTIILVR